MSLIDTNNAQFLAESPDFAKRIARDIRTRRRTAPKALVMAIRPKYAKAIYEGRKNWEFRKVPPPLFRTIYIYESAPVSKITGTVTFSEAVTGVPMAVAAIVRRNGAYTRNLPGISLADFEHYAGNMPVTALRVYRAQRLDREMRLEGRPPQNWGRFVAVTAREAGK